MGKEKGNYCQLQKGTGKAGGNHEKKREREGKKKAPEKALIFRLPAMGKGKDTDPVRFH